MNVSEQTTMEIKGIQQLNPGHDLNIPGKIAFDNFMFDSLINNFISQDRSRVPASDNQRYIQRSQEIDSKSERLDKYTESEDRKYTQKSGEINSRPEQSERDSEIRDQKYNNESEEINREPEQSDKYADSDNTNINQNSAATEKDSEQSEDTSQTDKENGLKTGALLFSHAEGLINNGETAANGEDGQSGNDTGAKNGLKMFNHTEGLINNGETAVNQGKEQTANNTNTENALKTGVLLNGLMKKSDSGPVDAQLTPITDTENPETLNSNQVKSENGLKTVSLLSGKANESAGEMSINIDKDIINAQVKTADSGDAEKEILKLSEKNIDARQNVIKHLQFREDAAKADSQQGNNNAKTLSDNSMSEFTGNFNREGGFKNYSNNSSRPVRVKSETDNTVLLNSSNVAHESGKTNERLHTGKVTRPSAFNEVIDKIIYVVKGNNRLGVTVENETIGKLNINVSLNKGMINIHINATNNATREFVESNIQHIIDSLSKNGVSVGGFSVGLRNHKNSEGNEDTNGYGNGNDFIADNRHEKEYLNATENVRLNNGLVSVFA